MSSGKLSEQCWVEQIPSWATKPFLLHVHYARRMPNIIYSFGLFKDAELIGVCTYGMPPSPFVCRGLAGDKNKDNVLELNRLVILPEYNGHNYGSFLISHSLKMLPAGTFVVSYADVGGWSHVGYVYQATNWLYTGLTAKRTDKYSESGKHPRHYDKNEQRRVDRTPKHRYVYLVGSKKDKRNMLKELRYPILPKYPKGNERKYDERNPTPLKTEKDAPQADKPDASNGNMDKTMPTLF